MDFTKHLFPKDKTLLEALAKINTLAPNPLVLFIIDQDNRMVGTLTDGDSRRALISGVSINEKAEKIMLRSFHYIKLSRVNDVREIQKQKILHMKLVPILDEEHHIVDIINLDKYKSRLPIDAVLMAGGKGERLRPLTNNTPKPLLPVGGKAIIDHNIEKLINYGVKHINVTVNYLREQIEEHFKDPFDDIQIQTVREPEFLGTIGSIRFVREFFNETVLVMNSDLFTNINYEDFYLHFVEHNADMSVAAIPYNVSIPYGILDLEGRNIQGLIEKPKYTYYANAGIYLIRRDVLNEIPEGVLFNATDLVEKLISEGKKVIRYPLNGTWIDIGNPQEYQKANDLVRHI